MYFSEFKQGLDYIGIRFSDEETRELFNFIDKVRDLVKQFNGTHYFIESRRKNRP